MKGMFTESAFSREKYGMISSRGTRDLKLYREGPRETHTGLGMAVIRKPKHAALDEDTEHRFHIIKEYDLERG